MFGGTCSDIFEFYGVLNFGISELFSRWSRLIVFLQFPSEEVGGDSKWNYLNPRVSPWVVILHRELVCILFPWFFGLPVATLTIYVSDRLALWTSCWSLFAFTSLARVAVSLSCVPALLLISVEPLFVLCLQKQFAVVSHISCSLALLYCVHSLYCSIALSWSWYSLATVCLPITSCCICIRKSRLPNKSNQPLSLTSRLV